MFGKGYYQYFLDCLRFSLDMANLEKGTDASHLKDTFKIQILNNDDHILH